MSTLLVVRLVGGCVVAPCHIYIYIYIYTAAGAYERVQQKKNKTVVASRTCKVEGGFRGGAAPVFAPQQRR